MVGQGDLGAGSVEAGERPPSTPSLGQGAVGFWSLFLRSQTLHWAPSPRLDTRQLSYSNGRGLALSPRIAGGPHALQAFPSAIGPSRSHPPSGSCDTGLAGPPAGRGGTLLSLPVPQPLYPIISGSWGTPHTSSACSKSAQPGLCKQVELGWCCRGFEWTEVLDTSCPVWLQDQAELLGWATGDPTSFLGSTGSWGILQPPLHLLGLFLFFSSILPQGLQICHPLCLEDALGLQALPSRPWFSAPRAPPPGTSLTVHLT